MAVYRIYTEKKNAYANEAARLLAEINSELGIHSVKSVRIVNRYDIEGIEQQLLPQIAENVFGEPMVDIITDRLEIPADDAVFAVAYLPGQFDQRADSCEQCVQLITCGQRPKVKNAKLYILTGKPAAQELAAIKKMIINPVDSCEVTLDEYTTLTDEHNPAKRPPVINGFCGYGAEKLDEMRRELGLAMDDADLEFCRKYFADTEKRDPTLTEIRIIDTYWSDHCRHTTFLTHLDEIKIEDERVRKAFELYIACRNEYYGEKAKTRPITLMDIGTLGGKYLAYKGKLKNLDKSEEINACSVRIRPTIDGQKRDWLLMFKNETHNHPTEIEPFGGAATCLGGAIRDPLSGRAYVYQAMRVTGAADPTAAYEDTLPNKLPQRKICIGAASGYSSYGNQIGLATGIVSEVYHPGYAAKRLETGAVIAAAPAENVIRTEPQPGDIVILVGGRTGRDGCGGATGSSKAHDEKSLQTCGAEVQKGNAPEERKIQRLFRNAEVTKLIKRCNDFGAGGVSVAIGELADGLNINLDAVLKKYEGLDATELAISESQERMAVVVAAEDAVKFINFAASENLEAVVVAEVTDKARLTMYCAGEPVADISREFLNSNGAPKSASVYVGKQDESKLQCGHSDFEKTYIDTLSDLNSASQMGLVERFDSTIGAGSVFMPYGGKNRMTAQQSMVGLLPVLNGKTEDCSVMSYGFTPSLNENDPYMTAVTSVISSIGKLVASGAALCGENGENCWLSFQEFFPSPHKEPARWALPFCALLGAFEAQIKLGFAAIGGKDSMSGSFEKLDVPSTLISFAVSASKASKVISPEFKAAGNRVYLIAPKASDYCDILSVFDKVTEYIASGKVISTYSVSELSPAEAVAKMAFGNNIGVKLDCEQGLFKPILGGFVVEAVQELDEKLLGVTDSAPQISSGKNAISLDTLIKAWKAPLESVYATAADVSYPELGRLHPYTERNLSAPAVKTARPRVVIPVFPGTNCEYDLGKRFEQAGALVDTVIIRNLNMSAIEQTVAAMTKAVDNAQILAIPGGFSGGDEPDGSGKFITAFFNNPKLSEAVRKLLDDRDGLALGICNGFQALIKLGLVPYGRISPMTSGSPTLTFNDIGRHQSLPVRLKVLSVKSPWLRNAQAEQLYTVPISHGEGKFIADEQQVRQLLANGQIATVYADENGVPTMKMPHNPNGSVCAVEGITSPDGRVLGKMGHDERCGDNLLCNVGGSSIGLFEAGVGYFG